MARKRRILIERRLEESIEDDLEPQDVPEKYRDMSWKEWLRGPFARTWFVVLSLFLDVILILEINRVVDGVAGMAISFTLLVPLLVCEVFLYRLWWGQPGKSYRK